MTVLAVDPGPTESAYCRIGSDFQPLAFAKLSNEDLIGDLYDPGFGIGQVVFEMVASYGMPVGKEVFETVFWTGRFYEAASMRTIAEPDLITRLAVKLHHCHDSKAKDSNITRALVDRFTPGQPNYGKGTKAAPGFFRGFSRDVWAAYALAVYAVDTGLVMIP